jgi:predicted unusual protein kinase regulating ubiquinone biosynthesis (AarF/ABC1/UbiB family)
MSVILFLNRPKVGPCRLVELENEMARKEMPTSRAARTAIVGRVVAGQAVRHAGTRAANMARSEERGQRALEKRHAEAAKALVDALGLMKGAAMKVGQMLSVVEVGLVPPEFREDFQRSLAKLRDAAPTVSFDQMRKVIEKDLDGRIGELFAEFDREPIAAASIGQVYRARLHDGRDVAVKVQYPGVATAVRADMQNLGLIMRAVKAMAPGLDVGAITDEIRERIEEELDYELEASNQRTAARLYRGHPFIVVPDVVASMSREHVIVSEFVEGTGFEALKEAPQATRDRVAEIVFRFYSGGLYRNCQFSPDPHPGNFLLCPDGRVAFLDYGLYKRMAPDKVELELACQRAVAEGDAGEVHRVLAAGGFLPEPERVDAQNAFDYVSEAFGWFTTDADIDLTPEMATEAVFQTIDPRSSHFARARHQELPPEHLFVRRMEVMVLAALGHLRATNNWHRIAREWMYGDAPVTELGRQEAAFLTSGALAA